MSCCGPGYIFSLYQACNVCWVMLPIYPGWYAAPPPSSHHRVWTILGPGDREAAEVILVTNWTQDREVSDMIEYKDHGENKTASLFLIYGRSMWIEIKKKWSSQLVSSDGAWCGVVRRLSAASYYKVISQVITITPQYRTLRPAALSLDFQSYQQLFHQFWHSQI